MQLIVSAHANSGTESLLLKKDCPKVYMIVVSWQRILFRQKWQYIYSQWVSKEGIVYLLMILNVNTYASVILERSLRANEGHIGVNEIMLTIMKQIWTQMNGYIL